RTASRSCAPAARRKPPTTSSRSVSRRRMISWRCWRNIRSRMRRHRKRPMLDESKLAEAVVALLLGQAWGAPQKPAVTITIVMRAGNDFDVHVGEAYADRLCWDEMVGQIAALTLTGKPRYPMLTPEEHEARRERRNKKREPEQPLLLTPPTAA